MPMPQVNDLDQYSDEYLLESHSNGRPLAGQGPDEVATELARRGVKVDSLGKGSSVFAQYELPDTPLRRGISKIGLFIGSVVLASLITQIFASAYIGRVLSVALLVVAGIAWLLNLVSRYSEKDKAKQDEVKLGLSPLMLAAADGDIQLVQQLIATGADVNETTKDGTTALMYAARNSHAQVIHLLIAANANLNAKSKSSSTALSIAERFGNQDVIKVLSKAGGEA